MIRSLVRMTSSLSVCLAGSMALLALPVMAQRGPAPELKYMSPKCASMLEAQRTAPSVMRNQPSFAEMRRNYNDQCAEDQSQAQRRWYAEKRETEQLNAEQDYAMKKQQLLSANEVKRKSDQCMEMRSALESRKKRTNLTEGEKRDLGLFETRYQERCN